MNTPELWIKRFDLILWNHKQKLSKLNKTSHLKHDTCVAGPPLSYADPRKEAKQLTLTFTVMFHLCLSISADCRMSPALGLTLWKSADLLDANLDRSALSLPARRRNNSSVCCEWGMPCNPLMEICYLGYAIWEMHILTDGVWDGCCSQSKTQVDVIFG